MKITTEIVPKTLTPQRKHRKLLKSGEGEVWSEEVEKVFVEGLKKYWESPSATYSRGRSRYRNQFLVDFLQKAGIERSKKQVASHVQVLRNMWKGEKEYQWVAGGEELFLETGFLAPVKKEDTSDLSLLSPADTDDSCLISPISSVSGRSPPGFKFEGLLQMPSDTSQPGSPISPGEPQILPIIAAPPMSNTSRGRSSSLPGLHRRYTTSISSPLAPRPVSSFEAQSFHSAPQGSRSSGASSIYLSAEVASASSAASSSSAGNSYDSYADTSMLNGGVYHDSPAASPIIIAPSPPSPPAVNRLTSINLFGEGLQAYAIPLHSYYSTVTQPSPRLLIKVKIRLPAIDDIQGSPTLHGIHASISLARPWALSATCTTDVYAASVHHSRVTTPFQPPAIDASTGESTASLPESELTRCRWLDANTQTTIYQRIVVDNDTMAVIVYDLDRTVSDNLPFAEVVAIQRYRVNSEKTQTPSQTSPSPQIPPSLTYSDPTYASQSECSYRSSRYPGHSIAYALDPYGDRTKSPAHHRSKHHPVDNSMVF